VLLIVAAVVSVHAAALVSCALLLLFVHVSCALEDEEWLLECDQLAVEHVVANAQLQLALTPHSAHTSNNIPADTVSDDAGERPQSMVRPVCACRASGWLADVVLFEDSELEVGVCVDGVGLSSVRW